MTTFEELISDLEAQYLEECAKEGLEIDNDKFVDWRQAAKRYAIFALSECVKDPRAVDYPSGWEHAWNFPHTWGYGRISGDIDCRKYECRRVQPITLMLSGCRNYRICRGGDTRGEPFITSKSVQITLAIDNPRMLLDEILDFFDIPGMYRVVIDAFNGYRYFVNFNPYSCDKIEIVEYLGKEDTGVLKCTIKYEDHWKLIRDISDTTHLFSNQFKSAFADGTYKDLSEEERRLGEDYIDDGCRDEE